MPIRTAKLFSGFLVPPGPAAIVTPPVGQTYLVKEIVVWNTTGAADLVQVIAEDASGFDTAIFPLQSLAAHAKLEWNGFLALIPGDTLRASSSGTASTAWVS